MKLSEFVLNLRWLKTVSSTFQDVDYDGSIIIATLYQLMLQSWYKKTAQSLVNMLVLKVIPTCSPVIGQFFDTMIVASIDKEWL